MVKLKKFMGKEYLLVLIKLQPTMIVTTHKFQRF